MDEIILWLTGYTREMLQRQIDSQCDFETFFDQARGSIRTHRKSRVSSAAYRVEEIEDT